tara:strand:+ start:8536 stop:9120 length:585 start_codon:yes stop_codon:yes gene_type:complete
MRDTIRLAICLVAYVLLFGLSIHLLATPAIAGDYIGNFERIPAVQDRPPQIGFWETTPTVIVCDSAPISQLQIASAIRFWERLGYQFYNTQYKKDPLDKCTSPNPTGHIIIHLATEGVRMEETSLAQTHFYVDNTTDTISWAIIYMRSDVRAIVLEHELGHALGFLHYNRVNHLMNEKWKVGGWDSTGLKNKHQ